MTAVGEIDLWPSIAADFCSVPKNVTDKRYNGTERGAEGMDGNVKKTKRVEIPPLYTYCPARNPSRTKQRQPLELPLYQPPPPVKNIASLRPIPGQARLLSEPEDLHCAKKGRTPARDDITLDSRTEQIKHGQYNHHLSRQPELRAKYMYNSEAATYETRWRMRGGKHVSHTS